MQFILLEVILKIRLNFKLKVFLIQKRFKKDIDFKMKNFINSFQSVFCVLVHNITTCLSLYVIHKTRSDQDNKNAHNLKNKQICCCFIILFQAI